MARLFAKIFEHANFGGQYRWIHSNVRSVGNELGLNDEISSIRIYRGNNYQNGDKMRFYQHANYGGGYLELGPGDYQNIHVQPYSFGDKISSIDVLASPPQPGQPIGVRLMVRVYQHVNYQGQYRDILFSENRLSNLGFNDTVSSIRISAGEDYAPGWVCDFFQHANYGGGSLQPGRFGPNTNINNIAEQPFLFNDTISSIRIYHM